MNAREFSQSISPPSESIQKLQNFLNDPLRYLHSYVNTKYYRSLKNNKGEELLTECGCNTNVPLKFRFTRERRAVIERILTHEAIQHYKPNTRLKCLSLGAGGGLQDFILCATLLLQGFSLEMNLIENNPINFRVILDTFRLLKIPAQDLQLSFTVTHYSTMEEFIAARPEKDIDISWSIDFTNQYKNYASILLAYHTIQPNGFFFYTNPSADIFFYKTSTIPKLVIHDERKGIQKTIQTVLENQTYIKGISQELQIARIGSALDEKYAAETKITIAKETKIYEIKPLHCIMGYRGLFATHHISHLQEIRDLGELSKLKL